MQRHEAVQVQRHPARHRQRPPQAQRSPEFQQPPIANPNCGADIHGGAEACPTADPIRRVDVPRAVNTIREGDVCLTRIVLPAVSALSFIDRVPFKTLPIDITLPTVGTA